MSHIAPSAAARSAACTVLACLLVFGAACSSGSSSSTSSTAPPPTATTTSGPHVAAAPGTSPQPTLADTVRRLLAAEQRKDHAASYRLLDQAARAELRDVADWTKRRGQLPPITGFTVHAAATADTVVADVDHVPGLDPFVGLSPAHERQTWHGAAEGGGWLADAEPTVAYVLPAEAKIAAVVRSWTSTIQACDQAAARSFEAVAQVYGTADGASKLCHSKGPLTIGAVARLDPGPASSDLVNQYSSDVLDWARRVPVSGPIPTFSVIVAPLGDGWKVLGVSD